MTEVISTESMRFLPPIEGGRDKRDDRACSASQRQGRQAHLTTLPLRPAGFVTYHSLAV